jgi:hypothetical protein
MPRVPQSAGIRDCLSRATKLWPSPVTGCITERHTDAITQFARSQFDAVIIGHSVERELRKRLIESQSPQSAAEGADLISTHCWNGRRADGSIFAPLIAIETGYECLKPASL